MPSLKVCLWHAVAYIAAFFAMVTVTPIVALLVQRHPEIVSFAARVSGGDIFIATKIVYQSGMLVILANFLVLIGVVASFGLWAVFRSEGDR